MQLTKPSDSHLNYLKTLSFVMKSFYARTTHFILFPFVIALCLITKGMAIYLELSINNTLANELESTGPIEKILSNSTNLLISIMIYKITKHLAYFIGRMAIEFLITPIGSIITDRILRKILLTDNVSALNLDPNTVSYDITEGSKASALMIKMLFFELLDLICEMIPSLLTIRNNFSTASSLVFYGYVFIVLVLSIARSIHVSSAFKHLKKAHDLNSQKEKIYTEVLDSIHIIKTSKENSKCINRYFEQTTAWEKEMVSYKLVKYTNSYMFILLNELLKLFMIFNYINVDMADELKAFAKVIIFHRCLDKIDATSGWFVLFFRDLREKITVSKRTEQYSEYKINLEKKLRLEEFKQEIVVSNLSLTRENKRIFREVSFKIVKGDKIALFGRNGSGKSSIFNILLGYLDYSGDITIDGIDLRNICLRNYRKLFTYVPQKTNLFNGSIFYNLSFGNGKSYKEIIEECIRMDIHDVIMTFPMGYNTEVGENGKVLNGGLRQKIFYTRAFLCDTEIYLFDEPTNNLDKSHSKFLLEKINSLELRDKTIFVICHDIEIVKQFPKIYYFNDNKIEPVSSSQIRQSNELI